MCNDWQITEDCFAKLIDEREHRRAWRSDMIGAWRVGGIIRLLTVGECASAIALLDWSKLIHAVQKSTVTVRTRDQRRHSSIRLSKVQAHV